MTRISSLLLITVALFSMSGSQVGRFSKNRSIEAYEVRPGILMFPTYTEDGRICEIGLERQHYSPAMITTSSGVSEEEFWEIADELVPENEKGPKAAIFGGGNQISLAGGSVQVAKMYENVSIILYATWRPNNEIYRFPD